MAAEGVRDDQVEILTSASRRCSEQAAAAWFHRMIVLSVCKDNGIGDLFENRFGPAKTCLPQAHPSLRIHQFA